jgi:hypothetical protein
MQKFLPDNDGIDHINIYSKGKTEIGRLLTNFAHTPFTHPKYGIFQSVEGFWYFLKTGTKHDNLKYLYGYEAKRIGKTYAMERKDLEDKKGIPEEFKKEILEAIRCKLRQNKHIVKLLVESDLPFSHYYCYGNGKGWKVYYLDEYSWIVDEIEKIRKICKDYYRTS